MAASHRRSDHDREGGSLPIPVALGYWLIIGGLMAVLLSRGLNTFFFYQAASAESSERLARIDIQQEFDDKREDLDEEIDKLEDELRGIGFDDRDRRDAVQKRLSDAREKRSDLDADQRKKEKEELGDLGIEAEKTRLSLPKKQMFSGILFVLGTMAFALGLLTVAFGGVGTEKWASLAMLLVIVVSVYVFGVGWAESLVGWVMGMK